MTRQMTSQTILSFLPFLFLVLHPCISSAQRYYDDFSDGSVQDASPVTWVERAGTAYVDEDDNLVLEHDPSRAWGGVAAEGLVYFDSSVRTQVRLIEGDSVWIAARYAPSGDFSAICYSAGLHQNGLLVIGTCGSNSFLAGKNTDLDVVQEDVMLQFDLMGRTLSLWAWRAGDPMPTDPVVWVVDDTLQFGLTTLAVLGSPSTAAFRFVQVDTTSIGLPGDFNRNGALDVEDIDLLTAEIQADPPSLEFDLNWDNAVDNEDRVIWVEDLNNTYFGDSNLDGEFDTGDLIEVLSVGKYETQEPAGWKEGDWDGDGFFGTSDFVLVLALGGYEEGPRNGVIAVPEPSSGMLACMAVVGLFVCFRNGKRAWRSNG